MTAAKFVISLDFELFWGVSDTQTIADYGGNVLGEWQVVPRLLAAFRQHRIGVTWATVGMAMCRDYAEWRDIRPSVLPGYSRIKDLPYSMDKLVKEHPKLFFARPLVEQILATEGQELATHTYSHFYCNEAGATPEQFAADLACARTIAADMGARFRSAVLPRNQLVESFLARLPDAGIEVYRGNAEHWLYRNGDAVPGGIAGRIARFADACVPLSGNRTAREQHNGGLVNVPASLFLYPWSARCRALAAMRLYRLKQAMTTVARTGGIFHLWWHPHNFGVNIEQNLALLEALLRHYDMLSDTYGMQSKCMGDFAASAAPAFQAAHQVSLADPALASIHLLPRSPR
jgi:peptidoglycan/xylan/chitin deacetylase (PgdA/CDA1 family)